ncbi:MAG TPA: hypothetical protein PKL65_02300 [Bacteroidales bacterium]|nr:hypothetical protein [Bacteroidales bacterium]HNR41037.1 hypothetical protein [Bacteroidales bacterium]
MKRRLLIIVICVITCNTLAGQSAYSGSFNFKNQTTFNLVSENDSVTVQIARKQIIFNNASGNLSGIKKIKRNHLLIFNNSDTSQVVQTKRKLTFQSGLFYPYKKRTSKELILADHDGQIVLNAEYGFRYPVANYKITIYDKTKFTELLSYATYYLFANSRDLKNAYETPYIYFGPY